MFGEIKNPLQDVGLSKECGTTVKNPIKLIHVHLLPLTVISVSVGSTVLFLSDVCGGDAILLRRRVNSCPNWLRYSAGHEMKFDVGMKCFEISFFYKYFIYFQIGVLGDFGGHHCSWCFPASGIR